MGFKIIKDIVSVVLTLADVGSDVALAIDYCTTDNPWWCGLTWTFIAAPIVTFPIVFCCFDDGTQLNSEVPSRMKFWKCVEICFESGPQLILQLYILALQDQDPSSTTGSSLLLPHPRASLVIYWLVRQFLRA